jgi:hypothetical protein
MITRLEALRIRYHRNDIQRAHTVHHQREG